MIRLICMVYMFLCVNNIYIYIFILEFKEVLYSLGEGLWSEYKVEE